MSNTKAISIVLSFIMLLSLLLSSCGKVGNNNTSNTKSGISNNSEDTSDSEYFKKYNSPITVTTVQLAPTGVTYTGNDNAENNPWTRLYKEQLGIDLKFNWIVNDDAQWYDKTNLMINSGDLPDFFMANTAQYPLLLASGFIADITDIYDKYASPSLKSLVTESGDKALISAKQDGRLMALPFTGSPRESMPMMIIRNDWLEKLNLPVPQNMEDVYTVAKAFAENDPDGNNVKDTIGLGLDSWFMNSSFYQGITNGFNTYPGKWIKNSSGVLEYGSIQPQVKTALTFLLRFYKDGLLDKNFMYKDIYESQKSIVSGKCGLFFYPMYAPIGILQKVYEADQTAEWGYYSLPSQDGKPAKAVCDIGVNGYWVINRSAKNPEAIIKMANLWVKTFYESNNQKIQDEYVEKTMWMNALPKVYKGYRNLDIANDVSDVLSGKKAQDKVSISIQKSLSLIKEFENGDKSKWHIGQTYGPKGTLQVVRKYRDENLFVDNEYYGTPTPTMLEMSSTLNNLESDFYLKVLTGNKTIAEFDVFVANWKKMGGDNITDEVNEWYKNKK